MISADTLYKLLTRSDWAAAKSIGVYRGSEHDLRDGFIHFSTAAQLATTAAKYFMGEENLVLLAVDAGALGSTALRWEPARGGDLFPHLYDELAVSAVKHAVDVPLGANGTPDLPHPLPE